MTKAIPLPIIIIMVIKVIIPITIMVTITTATATITATAIEIGIGMNMVITSMLISSGIATTTLKGSLVLPVLTLIVLQLVGGRQEQWERRR